MILKKLFYILLSLVCLVYAAQAQPLRWQGSRFAIDECGIRYNGEPLPLGQDTTEWVRVLGPPDRHLPERFWVSGRKGIGYLIWDNHGLALHLGDGTDTTWVQSAIFFFLGLDSEEGQIQSLWDRKFDFAYYYRPITKELEAELRSDSIDDAMDDVLFHADPHNYPFPITPIYSQVRLDGMVLDPYVRIGDLNRVRIAQGFPLIEYFPYRDFLNTHRAYLVQDRHAFYYDSTFSGYYVVRSPRVCQGKVYEWALRYNDFKSLMHIRVSTYRPWENAQIQLDQQQLDEQESMPRSKIKDGKTSERNKFYRRLENYPKEDLRKTDRNMKKFIRRQNRLPQFFRNE